MFAKDVGFNGFFNIYAAKYGGFFKPYDYGLLKIKLARFNGDTEQLIGSPNSNLNGKCKNTFIWNNKENPELIYVNEEGKSFKINFEPIEIQA